MLQMTHFFKESIEILPEKIEELEKAWRQALAEHFAPELPIGVTDSIFVTAYLKEEGDPEAIEKEYEYLTSFFKETIAVSNYVRAPF